MSTLLTIPGIMSDVRTWSAVVKNLNLGGVTLHNADLQRDATIEEMAARALSDTQGDLIVLAHSMGGRVGIEMARQAPERIRAIVLANTNTDGLGPDEAAHRGARIAQANEDMAAYARNWVPKVISSRSLEKADLVAQIVAMVEDCPPKVHEQQNRALLVRPDALDGLQYLASPVLLVTGSDDHMSTEASNNDVARRVQDAEVRIVEGAGHLLPFEEPQQLASVILDWLSDKGMGRDLRHSRVRGM